MRGRELAAARAERNNATVAPEARDLERGGEGAGAGAGAAPVNN